MMYPEKYTPSDVFYEHEKQIVKFYNQLDANATNTVYVEGIPLDASEREIAHIFRPFPGFLGLRLIFIF